MESARFAQLVLPAFGVYQGRCWRPSKRAPGAARMGHVIMNAAVANVQLWGVPLFPGEQLSHDPAPVHPGPLPPHRRTPLCLLPPGARDCRPRP